MDSIDKKNIDLISDPKKSFWKLSVPICIFLIFTNLLNIVDMMWVTRISLEATFAVGASGPILMIIDTFGGSIGQGTNSIISRMIGSGDYEGSYNALIHGLLITIVVGILMVFTTFFIKDIFYLLNINKKVDLILSYVLPQIYCAIIFLLCGVFCETFLSEGDSKTPVKIMVMTNILNLVLDPIFIFIFNLKVAGAAYASILSTFIGLLIFIYLYLKGKTKIPLSLRYFKFKRHIIFEIFKVAIPSGLEDCMSFVLQTTILSTLYFTIGEIGLILYSVSVKIREFLRAPIRAIGRGLISVSGHLFGAKKIDDLEIMYKYCLNIAFIISFFLAILLYFFRTQIYAFFSIINMETSIFYIVIFGIVLIMVFPISHISGKILAGLGKSHYSLVFNIVRILLEIGLMLFLRDIIPNGASVLVGIVTGEVIYSFLYMVTLQVLIKKFKKNKEDLVVT